MEYHRKTLHCPIRDREVEVILGRSPWRSWNVGVVNCLDKEEACYQTECMYCVNSPFDPFETVDLADWAGKR